MKIYRLFILTMLIMLVAVTACDEDKLDVEPVNEYLSENFFQTENQVFQALIAAYDPAGWTMAYGQWIAETMFGEIRSDNANAGGDPSDNDQPGWQELDDFRETTSTTVLHPIYRKYYIGIFRANIVLGSHDLESETIDLYEAEAKFLRAYYHFQLFRHFGPIPVVTSVLTPEETGLSRNRMSRVFEQIVQDLEEAIPVLPVSYGIGNVGRATRGAARALLGKAYLYWADMDGDDQAKFDLAADNLRSVVESGQYTLVDDYKALFAYNAKNTTEAVFEIQKSNLWPSDWGWFEGIEGNGIVQLCGIRGLCDDHPFYEAGWGFMMVTPDLYNAYLADDTYRRNASIASDATLQADLDSAGASCSPIIDETQLNPFDYEGYWQIKYANYKSYEGNNVNGGDDNLTKDANVHMIRYADVLLMLAEALVRGTGTEAEAKTYINEVRERAAGPGDNVAGVDYRDADAVIADEGWTIEELIQYERRIELACEGDRWYDLVRTGRADAAFFTAHDADKGANFVDGQSIWIPIALEETSVAKNLTDYPGDGLFE